MHSSVCRAQFSATAAQAQPALNSFQFQKSSGYEDFDPDLAKFEQSATTDLPLKAIDVNLQMFTRRHAAKNAAGRKYVPNQIAGNFKIASTNRVTVAAAAEIYQMDSLGPLRACRDQVAKPRRRQLLPAPKTAFLPAGDPAELRAIITQRQESNVLRIENARATARLNALNLAQAKAMQERRLLAYLNAPVKFVKNRLGDLLSDLRDLIDRLALA